MADATKIGVADATKMGVANARVANATQPFNIVQRLKLNKGEDSIWAALAPCPILLVRETILFSLLTRLK